MNSNKPDKMELKSMDISAANRDKLKQLFPSIFTETGNDKGELVESIDFEKLKAELGAFSDVFESRRERYGMDWPGKKDCIKLIQEPSVGTLKPCREESVNFDTTENLFIAGDNLEVLKILQKSYYNKVKVIYIDPPYNTGKEFIYPDNYTETLDTYLAYAKLVDDEGKKFHTNTPNEGRFHTKWLNMMYPRLYLAKNLLRDDGVIFISIDDHEANNLRYLCNEIFGEENFVANIIWEKKFSPQNDAKWLSDNHDHLLLYAKNKEIWRPIKLQRSEENNIRFSNPDNDPRGPWASSDMTVKTYNKSYDYPVITPSGKEIYPTKGRCWSIPRDKFEELIKDKRIWFGKTGENVPRYKTFLSEVDDGIVPLTIWKYTEVGHNQEARQELKKIFNDNAYFDSPKPVRLITKLLSISTLEDDIILDFFSGSCTTAHAVLDMNENDGGNRKFIMIQLPEPCDESSEASKAGYKTIADIGKERVRRVIKKMEEEQSLLDRGFKVFKLDKSNFKIWDGSNPEETEEVIIQRLINHIDHVDPDATQEDILYELLLKAGFRLTEKVEKVEMAGKTVFSIAEGALLICLEDEITRALIDMVAEAEPIQFICLDSGFQGNDQLKSNAAQTFAARNKGRDKSAQIIFRTV